MNSEKRSKSAWWVWPGRDASEYFLFMKGNNINSSLFFCLNCLLFYHDAKSKGHGVLESETYSLR